MPTIQCRRPEALKDWVSSVPADLVKTAEETLVKLEDGFRDTANFFGMSEGGNHKAEIGRACHNGMQYINKEFRTLLCTENGRKRPRPYRLEDDKSAELCRPFLNWMLYESPYHFVILNRDNFDFCENHGFVIAGDAPTEYVQANCILSRHFYEVPGFAFEQFNEMVARGIDGLIAYNIAFCNYGCSVWRVDPTALFRSYGGHRVHPAFNPEILVRMVNGTPERELQGTYTEAPSIFGCTSLFVDEDQDPYEYPEKEAFSLQGYRKISQDFHNYMLKLEGKLEEKAEGYRPPNPFVKKPTESVDATHRFTYEQAFTVVADYMQKYLEENAHRHE